MTLLSELHAHAAGFDIAIIAATISILIGGMLFGTGLGFRIRRMRILGAEEIGQGIISAAMVGALLAFTLLLDSSVSSLVSQEALPDCPGTQNPAGSPYSYYSCNIEALQSSFEHLGISLSRAADITGFASSLGMSVGVITAQPFFALESASKQLSNASENAHRLAALSFLELGLADFVKTAALAVFLPAGLILRTFFATRKLGAAAMAIAIAAHIVYPLLFLYSFTVTISHTSASQAIEELDSFNAEFASIPLLDLDSTSAVRDKVNEMSQGDFGSKVQPLLPVSFNAVSIATADLVLYPLASLVLSIVAAIGFYRLLSSPIFLPFFEPI